MEFTSDIRRCCGHAHLTVAGPLDAFSDRQVNRQVDAAVAGGCTDFTVDAGGVTFLDAGGLSAFVRLRNTMRSQGGALRFSATSRPVRWVCGVAGLDRSFGLAA